MDGGLPIRQLLIFCCAVSFWSYFMARFYDASMRGMEKACLARWRSELLNEVEGDVLEIGAGTGANLAYYSDSVSKLILTEPDAHMRVQLKENAARRWEREYEVATYGAEKIDFPDDSFDSIVSTLVLCSVNSPASALVEVRRLLKPGGTFLFIEHVLAKDRPRLLKRQRFWNRVWVPLCGNCHLTRDTEQSILDAGLELESINRTRFAGGPSIVSPIIKGVARKPPEPGERSA